MTRCKLSLCNTPYLIRDYATATEQTSEVVREAMRPLSAFILRGNRKWIRSLGLVSRGNDVVRYSNICCSRSGTSLPVKQYSGGHLPAFQGRFLYHNAWRGRHFSTYPSHEVVGMPGLSPTMERGTIVHWHVKEGDKFDAGDVFCDVETDKATVAFESTDEGYVAKVLVGENVPDLPVGTPIMVTVDEESNISSFKDFVVENPSSAVEETSESSPSPPTSPPHSLSPLPAGGAPVATTPSVPLNASASGGSRVFSSPLARKLAKQNNVDISAVVGTGPLGRVIAADVHEFEPSATLMKVQDSHPPSSTHYAGGEAFVDYPVSNEYREIAATMTNSKQVVPHYYLQVDVNLDKLLAVRAELNEGLLEEDEISVYDILLKAASLACKAVPDVNSSWMDTFVRRFDSVGLNILLGSGEKLFAPLIKSCHTKGVKAIADERRRLETLVQEGNGSELCEVGTFSVANLGSYGVKSFSPIIRPPQACMLAIGAIQEKVVPRERNGESKEGEDWQISECTTVTLSCDHRVVDGAVGAQWLAAFKRYTEEPLTMLL